MSSPLARTAATAARPRSARIAAPGQTLEGLHRFCRAPAVTKRTRQLPRPLGRASVRPHARDDRTNPTAPRVRAAVQPHARDGPNEPDSRRVRAPVQQRAGDDRTNPAHGSRPLGGGAGQPRACDDRTDPTPAASCSGSAARASHDRTNPTAVARSRSDRLGDDRTNPRAVRACLAPTGELLLPRHRLRAGLELGRG